MDPPLATFLRPRPCLVRAPTMLLMTLALSGCCGPLLRSERFTEFPGNAGTTDCCEPSLATAAAEVVPEQPTAPLIPDGLLSVFNPLVHCLAGPFTPRAAVEEYQAETRPPHSKFHPVPTRPVFMPDEQPPTPSVFTDSPGRDIPST